MMYQSFKGELASKWTIVRTSPSRTVKLAEELTKLGFEAWTPKEVIFRRRPRSNHTDEIEVSISPTYVFVRANQLDDALAERDSNRWRDLPQFSTFIHGGHAFLVSDNQIVGLQAEEADQVEVAREKRARLEKERRNLEDKRRISIRRRQRRAGRQAPRSIAKGDKVLIRDGAWAGMTGVVLHSNGRTARVDMGGWLRLNVETWQLSQNPIRAASSR